MKFIQYAFNNDSFVGAKTHWIFSVAHFLIYQTQNLINKKVSNVES